MLSAVAGFFGAKFTQKMRCHKCGHTDESEQMNVNQAQEWYIRVAKELENCPHCHQKSYALSAYTEEGLMELKAKCESYGFDPSGAHYCMKKGQLMKWQ